jgi:hypothetical protein
VNSGLISIGGPISSDPTSLKSLFLLLFGAWGKTGINCFVLITGYFMCKSQITLKKFMKLFLQVMFYKIVISTIFWISSYEPLTLEGLVKTLIPIRTLMMSCTTFCVVLKESFRKLLVKPLHLAIHISLAKNSTDISGEKSIRLI